MPSNLMSSQTRTTKHYSRTRTAVPSQLSVRHSPGISADDYLVLKSSFHYWRYLKTSRPLPATSLPIHYSPVFGII